MFAFLLTIFPAFSQDITFYGTPSTESASSEIEQEKKNIVDSFFDYALIHKYGATLASIGFQMDSSRYTQFQIIGPTVQTPVLFRFESAQYTTGVGGSFLRVGLGFLHKFDSPEEFYDPYEEFGMGMHYVYDWLNTAGVPKHVIGLDVYVAKIETVFKLMVEIPTDNNGGPVEPFWGIQAGFGGMVDLFP